MYLEEKNTNSLADESLNDVWQQAPKKFDINEQLGEAEQGVDLLSKTAVESSSVQTVEKESLTSAVGTEKPLDPSLPTILVVDDNEVVVKTYKEAFINSQYNVIAAIDGLDGLDKATKSQPDIIFTGIIMPRMDGFAMIKALRQNAELAHTPIVIFSHLGRAEDQAKSKELQVRDFIIAGSTSPEEVVDRIHNILTKKHYILPINLSDPALAGLVTELGGKENVMCRDDKTHVLRLSVSDPKDLTVQGRIECV